ncbi:hypothetical protein [Halostella sp. PRR32]|uniref:hypothetical protein n=1 Tax=Halostella sp. PRR32 TaxID=3098147 RepID=UPI002B1D5952|nr:hypothetical protein [Halostella sp. PRR32]
MTPLHSKHPNAVQSSAIQLYSGQSFAIQPYSVRSFAIQQRAFRSGATRPFSGRSQGYIVA